MASNSSKSVDSPGETPMSSRRPASILLDPHARFTASSNETTATAASKGGHSMAVTFWMANPPDMSFFSIHCAQRPVDFDSADFRVTPHVVAAEGRFVCLHANFFSGYVPDEFFMYKAGDGDGEPPSLDWVPRPADDEGRPCRSNARKFGIMPCSDGEHYLLAAFCDDHDSLSHNQLHIYSSESKTWSTKRLVNPCPGVKTIVPDKMISLGEALLGCVDLSCGLLICDLRQDPPGVRFIPLPKPLPANREILKLLLPGAPATSFRDLVCVNGVLKFIEMEYRMNVTESHGDKDVLFDSDLVRSHKRKHMDEEAKSWDGWRVVTWSRADLSTCWHKGCIVDVADILIDKSTDSAFLSGLRGETSGNLTFRDIFSAYPTLTTDGDDIVYLKSVVKPSDRNGWVVAVDLGNKMVESLGAYSSEADDPSKEALHLCTLSHYLNSTPGTKVSAYSETTLAANSADDPTSVNEDEIVDAKLRLLSGIIKKHLEQEKDHSRSEPVQNNLPPQQCFNKWNYPRYASPVPASNLHAYGNYNPLWQQPPPLRQKLTPSSVFVPHEASRYHGSSQQLPACAACLPMVHPQQTPSGGVWNP